MKKVIKGKIYDTEKAKLIGTYDTPNLGKSDFHYFEAGLYVTPKGNYFVAGEGHALSPFASHNAGSSSWGWDVIPKTRQEALEWAEWYLDEEKVLSEFGDMLDEA